MTEDRQQIKAELKREMQAEENTRKRAEQFNATVEDVKGLKADMAEIKDDLKRALKCCEERRVSTTEHTADVAGARVRVTLPKTSIDWRSFAIGLCVVVFLFGGGTLIYSASGSGFGCTPKATTTYTTSTGAVVDDEWVTVRRSWLERNEENWSAVEGLADRMDSDGAAGLRDATDQGSTHRRDLAGLRALATSGVSHARSVPVPQE